MASRQELERQLARLDRDMHEMKRRYPDPHVFASEFARHADGIANEASAKDADWAYGQVDVLLEKHGFKFDNDDTTLDEWAVRAPGLGV